MLYKRTLMKKNYVLFISFLTILFYIIKSANGC
nr:MAG TPA: hypothetical protein [Caudoviricetes sp.]